MCRSDHRGVIEQPPGVQSCCVYLNGPTAAVGVIAATGFTSLVNNVGSLVGAGGIFSMLYTYPSQVDISCPFGTCRSRRGETRCCLVFIDSSGRSICPVSCDESDALEPQ